MAFRSSSQGLQFSSPVADSTTTIPSGVLVGDRLYALVGTGAATALPVTAPAGWTQLGDTYAPTANFTEQLWYRDVEDAGEADDSVSWTWANTSSTWVTIVAHYGVDSARTPVFNRVAYDVDSAGPYGAPTVVVPAGDWLITFATARESPGTNTAKTWSTDVTVDAEREDGYTSNSGTGQKFVAAVYDSDGTVIAPGTGSGGGGGGSGGGVDLGPQARPTNTYNAIVTSAKPFRTGATELKAELDYWKPKLAGLDWMRIFPNPTTNLPPNWTDTRFKFIQDFGGIPFLSSKVDGNASKLAQWSTYLKAMPAWVTTVYVTDRHEPEGDLPASTYKANFIKFWNMIEALPGGIRARVKAGPVLTRQWTENTPGRTYHTHDPGVGDFFGVDMYMNSWSSSNPGAVATTFPNPVTFLSRVKAYTYDGDPPETTTDHRPRVFPELGGIGIPADTTGSMRADWLQGLQDELLTWSYDDQGWEFHGWIWWNLEGKSGTSLSGAGTKRWFQFDRRHTGSDGSYTLLPSVQPPDSGSGGGGSTASARNVSTNIPVNQVHVWAVTVPIDMSPAPDPDTVNPWSHLGLPQGTDTRFTGGVAVGGLQPWYTNRAADYAAMAAARSTYIRTDLGWLYLEPTEDDWQFSLFDPVVNDITSNGMEMLAILHTVPGWANADAGDYALPTDLTKLQNYAYQTALHYIPLGVTKYEVGNEINLPHPGWTPSGTTYADDWLPYVVAGVHQAATELTTAVTVLFGSLAPTEWTGGQDPSTFLTQAYTAGAGGSFDALAWHPYTGDQTPEVSDHMNADPTALAAIMAAHGDGSKKIWATEYGNPTGGSPGTYVTEAVQANYLHRAIDVWHSKPYAGPLFVYSHRDLSNLAVREDRFGVLRFDGTHKPAYSVMDRRFLPPT